MDKKAFRALVREREAALDSSYIIQSDRVILEKLVLLPEFVSAERVFTYISVGREPDTRAFVGYCIQMDKPVALPCDCEKDGSMSFALLDRPISELEDGVYGIPVPPSTAKRIQPRDGDIIIVPALCYDKDGFRLGHGGGYYDRYLFTHRIVSVGLCREAMIVDSVPREEHDIGTDIIITEKRIARPKQAPQIEK